VRRGCPLWIGKVDPGDARALLGQVSGEQVFIERMFLRLISEGFTTSLRDDLASRVVYTGRQPRIDS
jgi:hypothetical protein